MPPPGLQIYLWLRITFTFDVVDRLFSKSFHPFPNIVFTNLVTGERPDARMDEQTTWKHYACIRCRFRDVSLYFARSPPGRFDTTVDDSLPAGRFATWMIRHLNVSLLSTFQYHAGRFVTYYLDVSPPVWKFVICDTVRISLSSGGKTSKGAKCPGGKASR